MSKKIHNILITCAAGSGPLYLAKHLRKSHRVFLVDGGDQSPAPHLGLPFRKVPFGNDPRFPGALRKAIKDWNIDCIVPGADEELLHVAAICKRHPSVAAVLPSSDFISLCLNKKRLMRRLADEGLSYLSPFPSIRKVAYPAIVKPIYGRGSREVHIVKNARELRGYLSLYGKRFSQVLVQPFIAGDEYTVSAIVNDLNAVVGIVPKLVLSKRGITKAAVTVRHAAIEKLCRQIAQRLQPCGLFNVQLKWWKNRAYVFEINPRLSTTTVLTDRAFGNEVELFFRYAGAQEIRSAPKMKAGVLLYRYDENVFLKG